MVSGQLCRREESNRSAAVGTTSSYLDPTAAGVKHLHFVPPRPLRLAHLLYSLTSYILYFTRVPGGPFTITCRGCFSLISVISLLPLYVLDHEDLE